MRNLILVIALIISAGISAAPVQVFKFDNARQEALFQKLGHEIRCLVCQNQSIAESNAELAQDLRVELHEMLLQGKSEQEILDYLVQRYGDFVLYNPPVKPLTWTLWFGPLVIFCIALFYALRVIKSRKANQVTESLQSSELERLKQLQAEAEQTHKQE